MIKLTDPENQITTYTYDAVRLTAMSYPNGWNETYNYDANSQLLKQIATDPTNTPSKTIVHDYEYDPNGNILSEVRSGAGGQDAFDRVHTYDKLDRLIKTTGQQSQKNSDHDYFYDSLGNLVYEKNDNGANKGNEYWYNSLNQQVMKVVDNHDMYTYSFDSRGNLVEGVYHGNGANANRVEEQYVYDATNRMVKGLVYKGQSVQYEESHYIYNGFGDLVGNEWIIAKNGYGYTGVDSPPTAQVEGVVVCDRHQHTTGQGHINPTGNGHTTGGTTGGITPTIDKHQAIIHKDYVIDYTSPLKRIIMESESGVGGLSYRYAYGIDRSSVVAYYVTSTTGSVTQHAYEDTTGELVFTVTHPEYSMVVNNVVKLFYHQDHLGTTDYLTDNADGKVTSYVTYDDWGSLTAKAVLNMGVRALDLVQDYTGHPYDMVLGLYYAKARMYDADDRRFMAVDPVKGEVGNPQTMAQYTYCLDNPLVNVDPFGEDPFKMVDHYMINPRDGELKRLGQPIMAIQSGTRNIQKFFKARYVALAFGGLLKESEHYVAGLKYMWFDGDREYYKNMHLYLLRVNTTNRSDAVYTYYQGDLPYVSINEVAQKLYGEYFEKLACEMIGKIPIITVQLKPKETDYDALLDTEISRYKDQINGEQIPHNSGTIETRRNKMLSFNTVTILARLLHQESDNIREGHTAVLWSIINRMFSDKIFTINKKATLRNVITADGQYPSIWTDSTVENRAYRPHVMSEPNNSHKGWLNSMKLATILCALVEDNTRDSLDRKKIEDTLRGMKDISGEYSLGNNIENCDSFRSYKTNRTGEIERGGNFFFEY